MTNKILVVDDDEHVCDLVRIAFEAEGFSVDAALDGKSGLDKMFNNDYCIVLLDIMLPEVDGWEICRKIRSSKLKGVPIIMLTARGDEIDRVLGLELGADDYVTKPFSPRELVARGKALIRRSESYNKSLSRSSFGDLEYNSKNQSFRIKENELELTPKEMALLKILVDKVGEPVSREHLLAEIWGFDDPSVMTRTVDEHVKRLRFKIAEYDGSREYIHTVWGFGYKFEVKDVD